MFLGINHRNHKDGYWIWNKVRGLIQCKMIREISSIGQPLLIKVFPWQSYQQKFEITILFVSSLVSALLLTIWIFYVHFLPNFLPFLQLSLSLHFYSYFIYIFPASLCTIIQLFWVPTVSVSSYASLLHIFACIILLDLQLQWYIIVVLWPIVINHVFFYLLC